MVNEELNGVKRGIDIDDAFVMRKKGLNLCRCGGDAVFVGYKGGWFVKCTCCETMMAKQISVVTETIIPFETMEEAAKVWNKSSGGAVDLRKATNVLTVEQLTQRRKDRVKAIAEEIKNMDGYFITTREIASNLGLTQSIVSNHMIYVKEKYPQVKSAEKMGYYWKE